VGFPLNESALRRCQPLLPRGRRPADRLRRVCRGRSRSGVGDGGSLSGGAGLGVARSWAARCLGGTGRVRANGPSGGGLHGVAVCRLASGGRQVFRDGVGPHAGGPRTGTAVRRHRPSRTTIASRRSARKRQAAAGGNLRTAGQRVRRGRGAGHVARGADPQHRRHHPGRRAKFGDGVAQAAHAEIRFESRGRRIWPGSAAALGRRRSRSDRPHQRRGALRRRGDVMGPGR